MATFTLMKTTLQEESMIPNLAVQAFQDAFEDARAQANDVVYAENGELKMQKQNGEVIVLKSLVNAYALPESNKRILKRTKSKKVINSMA